MKETGATFGKRSDGQLQQKGPFKMMESNSSAQLREWPLELICETDALLAGENVTV
jgi:hypothetical protein